MCPNRWNEFYLILMVNKLYGKAILALCFITEAKEKAFRQVVR